MKIREFIFTLVVAFIIVVVIMNKSVNTYIEQKYHISLLDTDNEILVILGMPRVWLDSLRTKIFPSQEDLALQESIKDDSQQNVQEAKEDSSQSIESSEAESSAPEIHYPFVDENGYIVLKPHSTILFIGDSMMQGVGMTLGRELKKLGFHVIDIAKQSTGLTYVGFFDWNATLKESFIKNPNIDIVIMMVGANDPYNMPKIKYQSQEWIDVYTSRIQGIIDTTLEHKALLVWYQAPIVKKEPLNQRLSFLNTLYKECVDSAKQVFLESNSVLAPQGVYDAYVKNEQGKSIKVRGSDGIHFSGEGSRMLGKLFIDRLKILEEEPESSDTDTKDNTQDFATTTKPKQQESKDSHFLESKDKQDSSEEFSNTDSNAPQTSQTLESKATESSPNANQADSSTMDMWDFYRNQNSQDVPLDSAHSHTLDSHTME